MPMPWGNYSVHATTICGSTKSALSFSLFYWFIEYVNSLMNACVNACLGHSHSGGRPGESREAAGVPRRFYGIAKQRHQTRE